MAKKLVDLIIKNAAELVTVGGESCKPRTGERLQNLGIIKNGAVAVKNGRILYIGGTPAILEKLKARKTINAGGKTVMPGFVDCHTHLVFGGSREEEFAEKIKGTHYLTFLKRGGGILSTVQKTRGASSRELEKEALERIKIASSYGTTTMEVKSGYGLNLENELKILEVVKLLQDNQWIDLVPTFLGAHIVPREFENDKTGFLKLVNEMTDRVTERGLAEYSDVFVELAKEVFSSEEAREVLEKARTCGLKLKLHAGEFHDIGGVELGVELGAVSIDHLDYVSEEGMKKMAESQTIAVLLPGVPFHLMTGHYAPARRMIEVGVPVALATDFNPGSSPTLSIQMIIALAYRMMKMTPAEAIAAVTINAAHAIDRADKIGSLEVGKEADIIILNVPSHKHLGYWFGTNLVEMVIKNGKIVKPR